MGFGDTQQKTYVTIFDGKLAVRSDEKDGQAKKRETKEGKIIYERLYPSFTGKIKDIKFRDVDYNGKQWEEMHIHISDGTTNAVIQMPFPSGYAISFLRSLPNADLEKNVTLCPYMTIKNDKKRYSLYINDENSDTAEWYFTKDSPKGMPELVPFTKPGSKKVEYSDIERNNFLKSYVEQNILPILKNNQERLPASAATTEAPPAPVEPPNIGEEDEACDLPF